MAKIIATHNNPDLDAICSIWLLKKFDPSFEKATIVLVPAGTTYKNQKTDENDGIVHVDVGLGKFDHHQTSKRTCAAELVFNYLKSKFKYLKKDKALVRLIKVVNDIDHFSECLWPNPEADYFNFLLPDVLDGLKISGKLDDQGLIEYGSMLLEGVYSKIKIKVKAEENLKEGYEFTTKWGKAIGMLTHNNNVLKLGLKTGYIIVIQKDGNTEHVRIKARPKSPVDLTEAENKLKKLDPKATWFLHKSKKMLLNGSSKNPEMRPSSLSLKKVIEVVEGL
ncbi:chromate resistance protein ChrB domain-containing protein [Patescibacteria group bacterium]